MIQISSRNAHFAAALLLAVHTGLLAWAATRHSPTVNEVGHMAAGLSHWQFGRFDLYRVNPPLVRLAATAPVAQLRAATDWHGYSLLPGARSEFECGRRFIDANGERSFWLFAVARWACVPFSLLGGFVCYRWAGELYGAGGGLLSLALWCFSPNILAHAQMITPDVGAAAMGAAACWLFWKWLREPVWSRAFVAGAALGLAELTKATLVLLYAVWPLAWLLWRCGGVGQAFQPDAFRRQNGECLASQPPPRGRQAGMADLRQATQLVFMALLGLYLLNVGYAFEGSFEPLGRFRFISRTLGGPSKTARPDSPRNRFAETSLAGFRVPLPANYLLGIDSQKSDFEGGADSYLRGQWRRQGWWYYYLYALAIKVPLGMWALWLMALGAGRRRRKPAASLSEKSAAERVQGQARLARRHRGGFHLAARDGYYPAWRDELMLLLPVVAVLALVSSQTGFSRHPRYMLPAAPFVFIWIGRLRRVGGAPRLIAAVALAWMIGSSLWFYPHSLSYFNELAGGPLGGRWHLLDSSIDWGQDLLYLKRWRDRHPEARPLGLAYFGCFNPRAAGIEFSLPPQGLPDDARKKTGPAAEKSGPRPGWYAVSVMLLHGSRCSLHDGQGGLFHANRPCFTYFQRFRPVARAGYSIYIYHLQPAEVNRVRREMGLPPVHSRDDRTDASQARVGQAGPWPTQAHQRGLLIGPH